jgi:hypothetical protein
MGTLRVVVLLLGVIGWMTPAAADNTITVYGGGHISINATRTLPVYVPLSPNIVTATSTAYPEKTGSTTLTITQPAVQLLSGFYATQY